MMDQVNISEILQAFSTLLFALTMFILKDFKKSMDSVKDSISSLNTNIATLIQSDKDKDKRIDEHKEEFKRIDKELFSMRQRLHDIQNETQAKVILHDEKIKQLQGRFNE